MVPCVMVRNGYFIPIFFSVNKWNRFQDTSRLQKKLVWLSWGGGGCTRGVCSPRPTAIHLLEKDVIQFWKDVDKSNLKGYRPLSESVGGVSGHKNIANVWRYHYMYETLLPPPKVVFTPNTRVFSAAEILLRIYQNPIHLNGTRWRTRFWRQREIRQRKNVVRQRAPFQCMGF